MKEPDFYCDFITPIGTVRTWFLSDNPIKEIKIDDHSAITAGYQISLEVIQLKKDWVPEGYSFESSIGRRWFISKHNNHQERLTIYCMLIDPTKDSQQNINSGEYLDSLEIENKTHHLHIGTEDGEMMQRRAESEDYMPSRFKNEIGFFKSFTEYVDFGFKTNVPDLKENEKVYFHFLVATNKIKQSVDYPNERDASTWFAVDQFKSTLDKDLK